MTAWRVGGCVTGVWLDVSLECGWMCHWSVDVSGLCGLYVRIGTLEMFIIVVTIILLSLFACEANFVSYYIFTNSEHCQGH